MLKTFFLFISISIVVPISTFGQAGKDSIQYENLVFEGAGIRGLAYCGALMEMDDRHLLQNIQRVAGTSSGAITAALLAVGYTPQEIFELIGNTNFAKFNDGGGFFIGGTLRLFRRMGYYKGQRFTKWMENCIAAKVGHADITFMQLHEHHLQSNQYKELIVTATCMNHQKAEYFSYLNYPNMRIVDAVRASMAVPLYFEPLVINDNGGVVDVKNYEDKDHVLLDGGFLSNFPIWVFDDSTQFDCASNQTIGFRIDSDYQIQVDRTKTKLPLYYTVHGTLDLVGSVYYIMKENLNRFILKPYDWKRTVSISDCNIGPKVKRLSPEEKALFIKAGREGLRRYLDEPGFQ
jgi:NTE family protein